MEEAEPICETPEYNEKINFIEELLIKGEQNEFKIELGKKEYKKELIIRVTNENIKNVFYFQHSYKCTSSMSCRKIAKIINNIFLEKNNRNKGKQLKISFKTVSNYLSET